MQFTEIKTFDIIEESITDGQLLAEITTDVNSVSYEISSGYQDYFTVIDNKIYLSGIGKLAINKDNPADTTEELRSLELTVIAINSETDAQITQNIVIKINRVIDNPPYVLDKYSHLVYTHNLFPNERVVQLKTVYNCLVNILGTNASYFDIEELPDIGTTDIKIKLNNNGVNKYNNLDFGTLNANDIITSDNRKIYKHEIVLNLIDFTNGKSIIYSIFVNFVEGDKYNNIPVKNNLEIQAELLADKISDIITDIQSDNDRFSFDISMLKRKIENSLGEISLNSSQITKLYNLIQETNHLGIERNTFQNEKIKSITESNSNLYDTIYGSVADYFKKPFNSDLYNKAALYNTAHLNSAVKYSSALSSKAFADYLMARNDTLVERRFENYTETLNSMFTKFRTLITSNIISPFTLKTNELASGVNVCFATLENLYTSANITNAKTNNNTVNIAYLDSRLQTLESFTMNDWSVDTDWNYSGSTLRYRTNNVLTWSSTNTTLKSTQQVILSSNGTNLIWNGSTLSFSDGANTTVDAAIFTGTATKAKYADLAEYYLKENSPDYKYEPGDIVYINRGQPLKDFEITMKADHNHIAGVVTTNPGFVLNAHREEDSNYTCIALNGRVPVKCLGNISKGMYLYPGTVNPNVAEGTHTYSGSEDLIGIALENSPEPEIGNRKINKILSKVK